MGRLERNALLHALAATDGVPDAAQRDPEWPRNDDLELDFAHFLSIYALGWLATLAARDALAARLESAATDTRWSCALALGLSHDPRATVHLQRMLTEAYPVNPEDSSRQASTASRSEAVGVTIKEPFEAFLPCQPSDDAPSEDATPLDFGYLDDRSGQRALAVTLLAEERQATNIASLRRALLAALSLEGRSFQLGMFASHLSWTGFYEPKLVYGLGQLGAVAALMRLAGIEGDIPRDENNMDTGTQGRLAMWRVHVIMGSLQAHERLTSDERTLPPESLWAHSPHLRVEAGKQLEGLFGLEASQRDRDLEAYDHDLISRQIWQYHLHAAWRQGLAAQLHGAG